jgi:hypothetical protein
LGATDIEVTSLGNKNGKDWLLVDEGAAMLVIAKWIGLSKRKI